MRILKFSLCSALLVLTSCAQMPHQESQMKSFVFNPSKDLGGEGSQLQEKVDAAKKAGGSVIEFLASDLFIKANDASMRGDFQTASQIFKYVVELAPDDLYVKKKYAYELIRAGEVKDSEKLLEAVFKNSNYKDETVGLILASVYTTLEKSKEARQTYQRLLTINPASEEACLFLARSYAVEKLYKAAHGLLANCEKKSDENPVFSFLRGKIEYERGLKKEAKAFFTKSLALDSTYAQAALAIGALYEEKENLKEALKVYQAFVSDDANSNNVQVLTRLVAVMFSLEMNKEIIPYAETLSSLDNTDLNLKVRLGLLYTEVERYDDATKLLNEVLAVVPDSDKVLYYMGALKQQVKKPAEALEYFKKIAAASPLFGDAGVQIGQIMGAHAREDFINGNKDGGKEFNSFVDNRAKENPDMQVELRMIQASFFEDTFQYKNAIATLKDIKDHKNFTESHRYYLASILEKNGDFTEARTLVQAIIDKDPNNAHALNFLGYSYLERNEKLDIAFEYISKAVALKPDDGYIRDSMAWYFFQTGKLQEALGEAKKASELVKGDPTITKHLGMIYQRLRYYDKAKVYLTEALKGSQAQADKEDVLKLLEDVEKNRTPASVP